jgi:hypothetical protein
MDREHGSRGSRRRFVPFVTAACLSALWLTAAPPAGATTVGQLAPESPASAICGFQDHDIVQTTITSGASYAVPPFGATIVSWSTNASIETNQLYTLKVFRRLGPTEFKVITHDGPRPLIPGTLNTFPVNIAVQPGDIIGLNFHQGPASSACEFVATSADVYHDHTGSLADGESASDFITNNDYRVNVSAVVKPSNAITLGKARDNKRKGTATVAATVPGPGVLSVTGKGVKAATAGGGKAVTAPGTVKLTIKPVGKSKKRLASTGKAKANPKITFTPTDGDPNGLVKRLTLIKRH